jgi:trans-aconitate 2-methyltransferase
MTKEWDAASYHKVSGPQTSWGRRVLSRLELAGDERVIDAGCGTGRLTAELLERLPRGRLVAIDRSWNMLITARANLRPDFGPRVSFVRVELPLLPFAGWADLVFSTATFHWVRDHQALFDNIRLALRPGGRLFAQCGGGPNLARAHALAEQVMARPPFAPYFRDWSGVWEFSDPEATARRLAQAGFEAINTSLEEAPTTLADEASYREFVTTVIYNPHLARLPDAALRARFIDEITALAAREDPPYTLDYWRLNIEGRRPSR